MSRLLDITAKILSVLLYPLFVPTYGVALFCYAYSKIVLHLPAVWVLIAITGTFLLTCVLPMVSIWVLIRRGTVKDFEIADARERSLPYLYATLGFAFWSYLMLSVLKAPLYIGLVCVGGTVAIGLVALINSRWKISAHLTGLGGLIGGLFSYCLGVGAIPTCSALGCWLGVSLLLMYARLRLNAHTSAQVSAGWLLGLSCTFLPYWIAVLCGAV